VGGLKENYKRKAVKNADEVLNFLEENWVNDKGKKLNVQVALETGPGVVKFEERPIYALINEYHYLKFLKAGRDFVTYCIDFAYLDLAKCDFSEFLSDEIGLIHLFGTVDGKDIHTIPSEETLSNYSEVISFLKAYDGDVCLEIKNHNMSVKEFLDQLNSVLKDIASPPTEYDFNNLMSIEERLRKRGREINLKNFDSEMIEEYIEYKSKLTS
jgi:hypothetical protein